MVENEQTRISETSVCCISPFLTKKHCEETLKNGPKLHNLYICEIDTRNNKKFIEQSSKNRIDIRVKLTHKTGALKSGYTIDGLILYPISD